VAIADAYQMQLKDGAKYVETLQNQIDEAGDEITKLHETIAKETSGKYNSDVEDELSNLRLDLAARDKKLDQVSEYVASQKLQIDQLTVQTENLRVELESAQNTIEKGQNSSGDQELIAQIQDCEDR
jgi:paraquat-inducible protein B